MPADADGSGFRVRGWRTGKGWVEVQAHEEALADDGRIVDQDAAILVALEARDTFDRIEVLDDAGVVVATVEKRRATVPGRGVVNAPALAFLAVALRLELAARRESEPLVRGTGKGRGVSATAGVKEGVAWPT